MPTNVVGRSQNPWVESTDLSPWVETPESTRVSRFRYDHISRALQVQWTNGKNPGYIYDDVPYETYRSFARAISKGKYINAVLNGFPYGRASQDQMDEPSNPARRGIRSRVRG